MTINKNDMNIPYRYWPSRAVFIFSLFFFLFYYASSSYGQGFQVNLQGQKQISMGGAGVATSLDAASILYNPGALVFQKENSIMAGISPLFLRVGYAGLAPSTYKTNFSTTAPPFSAYAAFGPKSGKVKFGIGIYTPFGGAAKYDDQWAGKYVLQSLKLRSVFFQPTVSYKLSERFGFGAGFVIGTGTVDLKKAIPVTDANGNDGQAHLSGNALGYGFNAGIFYKASDKINLGLSYRSQVNIKAKNGTATFPPTIASILPSPNTFSTTLNLPSTASLGLGYAATPKLLLTIEADYVGWSSYKKLEFDYGITPTPANANTVSPNTVSPRNYQDSYDLRIGGQYSIKPNFFVRAGAAFGATPVKDGYVTPEAPDADRIELSAGLGYNAGKNWVIDASFLYVDIMKRTQTNIESNFGGTFKTNAYIPGISIAYKF